MASYQRVYASALTVDEAKPLPTEFRIFPAGTYGSTKGEFTFDAEAAQAVLAQYAREGHDLAIDLNHEMVTDNGRRPDSGDARGWFKLAMRGGELWAVDVRWTPDGERRLREGTQRFISPAFVADKETGRIHELWNVALVAMPATFEAQPLIAASKHCVSASIRADWYIAEARRNGSR